MLELMHFPEELLDASEFKEPVEKAVGKAEMQMAKQLIQSMTSEWKPEQYTDQYHEALEKMIEEKIEHGGEAAAQPPPKRRSRPTSSTWCLSSSKAFSKPGLNQSRRNLPRRRERRAERRRHKHLSGKRRCRSALQELAFSLTRRRVCNSFEHSNAPLHSSVASRTLVDMSTKRLATATSPSNLARSTSGAFALLPNPRNSSRRESGDISVSRFEPTGEPD